MSRLLEQWVRAMREGDHEGAWALSGAERALLPRESRDNPALPYHLRWVWDLGPFADRHVLVRCYHGLGDTIQFLRFLPKLRSRAASVGLEIQPRLLPLLGDHLPVDRILAFDPEAPAPRSECDLEIMELSFALRLRPEACPPPYVSAPPAQLPHGTIGLCCLAGDWDESRSLPPELVRPHCEGRDWITLDPRSSDLPVLNPEGCPYDMLQTAALVAGSSLVITVDTMIAHLAGAMNRPVWLLLKHQPDWRWAPETGRCEWYPSMRLFAQPRPGAWASVVRRVGEELDRLIPKRRPNHGSAARLPPSPIVLGRSARQGDHPADQA